MIETGIIGGIKAVGSYIALPITIITAAIGFQFKRLLGRVDELERDLSLVARALAVTEAKMDNHKERLDKMDVKLDRILEYVSREKR